MRACERCLIDTHYGVPSRRPDARIQRLRSSSPIARQNCPRHPVEKIDPEVQQRAQQLAARAPVKANAKRGIYLCHNFCEMGAVSFASVLADIKSFSDTHPDDVVVIIIQDATTPAETSAAITRAGLDQRACTLAKGESLPTLGDLIDQGKHLLVFAEVGGSGAPDWYQTAYDWYQETGSRSRRSITFNCQPNRGPRTPAVPRQPLAHESPPDPSAAATSQRCPGAPGPDGTLRGRARPGAEHRRRGLRRAG